MWHSTGLTSPITHLLPSPLPSTSTSTSPRIFAVSYSDGSIRLWSFDPANPQVEAAEIVAFNGHKKSITTMAFDSDGSRLASGGTEGEIVVWDRVAEVGLFRLKGHRAPISGLQFIPHPSLPTTSHPGFLISTAKDSYLKLWDLGTQHCIQTLVVGRGEVHSLAVKEESPEIEIEDERITGQWIVLTGSGDGEAKVWAISKLDLATGIAETSTGEVSAILQTRNGKGTEPGFLAPNTDQAGLYFGITQLDSAHHSSRLPYLSTPHTPPDIGSNNIRSASPK